MITIVEPQKHISSLWGKQKVKKNVRYRLMKYVLQFDYDKKVLLHNVVTGRLVVLEQSEKTALETLPIKYEANIEQLIEEHFLVPETYDEHTYVEKLRIVLRTMSDNLQGSGLTVYTILPTTACNARCYYCFEHGIRNENMTANTANEVVEFIAEHNCGKRVHIKWFGGEPTIGANRITQICEGLKKRGVQFLSTMTTNGYLFDEEMCNNAKKIWNLERIVISVDGTGEYYNQVKRYIGATDNPYERVLNNIGLLIDQQINVRVRMNFDESNIGEFKELLADIRERYPPSPYLEVCAHYINDVQIVDGHERHHGTDTWYNEKIHELHQMARSSGYLSIPARLPHLDYRWCQAASKRAVTITPLGKLVSCYEFMEGEEIKGDIKHGIINTDIDQSWRRYADNSICTECPLFPDCVKIFRCKRNKECVMKNEKMYAAKEGAIRRYEAIYNHI